MTETRSSRLSVLVVDDHEAYRRAVRAVLATDAILEVVAEAATAERALELATERRPAVVLMDLVLPGMSGLDAIRAISAAIPGCAIVAVSAHFDRRLVGAAFAAGAAGCVAKDSPPEELIAAVHATARGDRYVSARLAAQ